MKGSWKTTVMGICSILGVLATAVKALVDGDPSTTVDYQMVVAGITAGVGLIMARDNDKSSEDVGAK